MNKNPILQDAVDFARQGDTIRRALRPKKKINNKHYKKMRRRMLRR